MYQIRNLGLAKFHYMAFLGVSFMYLTRAHAIDHSNFYANATKKEL
jgi:hypothetical protein